jgi:hypothetical protein
MLKLASRMAAWMVLVVAFGALSTHIAAAKTGHKKVSGTVTAWDGTTLEVTPANGDEPVSASVSPAAKVKLAHHGNHAHVKNPSRGSLDDLSVGDQVLKMKIDGDEVTKIRLRQSGDEAEGTESDDDDDADETDDEECDEHDGDDDDDEADDSDEGDDPDDVDEADDVDEDEGSGDVDEVDDDGGQEPTDEGTEVPPAA